MGAQVLIRGGRQQGGRLVSLVIPALWLLVSCFAIALSATNVSAANGPPAMVVPGQFNVSATGAATYTIPIAVPPGTAGMVPALSLDYSSQNGDGIVGLGWTLSGLPSITRCPKTVAQDGVHGGVNYNSGDRLCMEGQRLIYIQNTGSGYGKEGAEYRTEIDSFSKIVGHNDFNSTNASFEVWTKSGQHMEFGNSIDSRVLITRYPQDRIRLWAVNKISDTVGNYLTVTYNCAPAVSACGDLDRVNNGEVYPLRIDYTGHGPSPSVSPYNSVRFQYLCRNGVPPCRADAAPQYQGGFVKTTVLLSNIQTYQGSSLVYDYQLTYPPATTATTHSHLTQVKLCDGGSPQKCVAPTTFGWQGGADLPTMIANPITIAQGKNIQYGNGTFYKSPALTSPDFNGDGLTDILINSEVVAGSCLTNGNIYLGAGGGGLSTANATVTYTTPYSPWQVNGSLCTYTYPGINPLIIDINGDGRSDISTINLSTKLNQYLLNDGLQHFGQTGTTTQPAGLMIADFNGDGLSDIFSVNWPNTYYLLNNGANNFASTTLSFGYTSSDTIYVGDFDGDGCGDLLSQGTHNQINFAYLCAPAAASVGQPNYSPDTLVLGDFNGDGKTDILDVPPSGQSTLLLSQGTNGFLAVSYTTATDWGKYQIVTGDWNGDGKTDLALIASGAGGKYGWGTSHAIWLSTGTGFVLAATIPNTNPLDNGKLITASVGDWNSDGASDLWIQKPSTDMQELFAFVPQLLISISNGIGSTTNISYLPLNTNGSLYTRGSSAVFPTQDLNGPMYVVKRVSASNGLETCTSVGGSNCYNSTYSYTGAQTNLQGRGFLGFSTVSILDEKTNIVQTTTYMTSCRPISSTCNDFPYTGLIASQTKKLGTVTLSSTINTYSVGTGCGSTVSTVPGVYFTCLTQSIVANNDLDGTPFPTTTTVYTYDTSGNALTVNASVSYGGVTTSTKNTTNTYADNIGLWLLGRLSTVSVNSVVGGSNLTRQSCFTYDGTTGLLLTETIEPGDLVHCTAGPNTSSTTYTYDAFGHRIITTVSGADIATPRKSYAFYDSLGEFQTSAANALGQYETWTYDQRFGLPISHTGPNFLSTTWSYDTFGRLIQEVRPDDTQTSTSYIYCGTACPATGQFYASSTINGPGGRPQIGPASQVYYDMLSRNIASDTMGFDGSNIRVATIYDDKGRVQATSRPYFAASASPAFTQFTYDALGRVETAIMPDGSVTIYCYSALTNWTINSLSQATRTIKNPQGLVASVSVGTSLGVPPPCAFNGSSSTTNYTYDALGNLLTVTDPANNVVSSTYDIRGNKIGSVDPDMGRWTYAYDVLGELTSQTDAQNQTTSLEYDQLGRVIKRTENDLYSTWTYGNSAADHNVGHIIRAKACPVSDCASIISDKTYVFDRLGREIQYILQTAIDNFGYTTTYDNANGQIASVTYPSGYTIYRDYNSTGFLNRLRDDSNATVWTINTRDAEMHITSQTAGNGVTTTQSFDPNTGLIKNQRAGGGNSVASFDYTFDKIGNLTGRTDNNGPSGAINESFCYDNLNRLKSYVLSTATCPQSGSGVTTVTYDIAGNITSKSDTGIYHYDGPKPHAVTWIAGTVDGLVNPQYIYDGNGNLTCVSANSACGPTSTRLVNLTSFNMAAAIVQGSNSLNLTYDDQHQRLMQVNTVSGTSTTTTVYINDAANGAMSERVTVGSTTPTVWNDPAFKWLGAPWAGTATANAMPTWIDYITIDGRVVAQRKVTYPQTNAWWEPNKWLSFNWGAPGVTLWGSAAPANPPRFTWLSDPWNASPNTVDWSYFNLDHLGSVGVITDKFGGVVQRLSFDAWGKQRNPNGSPAACGTISAPTTKGFTNQEEMPIQCLVNLNARLYDASVGKFLAADPVVGAPLAPNAFNRYSYVFNNPLSLTDTSGLCPGGCFFSGSAGFIVPIVTAVVFQQYGTLPQIGGAFGLTTTSPMLIGAANAAIAGGLSGGIATGNLKAAALSALQAGLFNGIGFVAPTLVSTTASRALTNGLVGGITSAAGGGNFGSGFLAAGVGSLAAADAGQKFDIGRLAVSSALGGAASVLGGGKFTNGALTAAFAYVETASYDAPIAGQGDINLGGNVAGPWIGNPACPADARCLTYATTSGGPGLPSWDVQWQLTQPAGPHGGIIDQIIIRTGTDPIYYHEAWEVNPGQTKGAVYGSIGLSDDTWARQPARSILTGSARYYDGQKIPSYYTQYNPETNAGALPSTTRNTLFNLYNATPPVVRKSSY